MVTLATGFAAGVLSGFLGIGGGILIIPVLVYVLGFSQKVAQGTTLTAMIAPIGLLAAMSYWKAGNMNIKAAIFIAAGFILGGWLGGYFVQDIPELTLKRIFAVLLLVVAIKMWFGK